jgi:hypothetical protein
MKIANKNMLLIFNVIYLHQSGAIDWDVLTRVLKFPNQVQQKNNNLN